MIVLSEFCHDETTGDEVAFLRCRDTRVEVRVPFAVVVGMRTNEELMRSLRTRLVVATWALSPVPLLTVGAP